MVAGGTVGQLVHFLDVGLIMDIGSNVSHLCLKMTEDTWLIQGSGRSFQEGARARLGLLLETHDVLVRCNSLLLSFD